MSSKSLMLAVIVVAVFAGLMGGVGNYLYLQGEAPVKVSFLVAQGDIEPDTPLTWGENVTWTEVPAELSDSFRRFAIETVNSEIVEGKKTYERIRDGELILYRFVDPIRPKAALFDEKNVAPGYRAISIPIGREGSVSNVVQPGDHVDILGTFTIEKEQSAGISPEDAYLADPASGNALAQAQKTIATLTKPTISQVDTEMSAEVPSGPFTQTILQRVLVVGTGDQFRQEDLPLAPQFSEEYDVVTFKVRPEEAELLTFAQAVGGQLSLVLRNPEDLETKPRYPMTAETFVSTIKTLASGNEAETPVPTASSEPAATDVKAP